MNLVNFLGWENSNGIYRSEVYGELYRVVNNRLETFVPEISDWRESNIRINKLYKLKPMKQAGTWSEGFEIHNEEEWELVKAYYLQKGFDVLQNTEFRASQLIKNNVMFYAFLYYGKLETTIQELFVKRNLILKPIDWEAKHYPKHCRKIKFDDETYWQRNSNLDTVCLLEKEYTTKWYSTDVLDTLKE